MTGIPATETDASSPELQRRLADFAMVLDLLGTLPGLMDEEKVIASIFNLMAMLCAPASIVYVPLGDNQQKAPQCCPQEQGASPDLQAFLADPSLDHAPSSSGRGFLIRLKHGGDTLGVLNVDGVACPQYLSHYLNLAVTIAQVCGLAVQNARIYQQLRLSIAELERAERDVLVLNEELRQHVRQVDLANQELDAFVYAVSHDLRAPLRAMHGFSQALQEDYGESLSGMAREYLDQISLASRNMGELIDGLLKLSRSTRGELRQDTVDLSAMGTRLFEELARAEPTRRVVWTVTPGLAAKGDVRMIEAVLQNLLGNAWKYTAVRAEAVIELGTMGSIQEMTPEDPECPPETAMTVFFVRDNGAGFDMRYSDKLFRPFQRLHRQDEFPGIGIGLATVQRILHRHGGKIWSTSEPAKGAIFYFSLPSTDGLAEEDDDEEDPIGRGQPSG